MRLPHGREEEWVAHYDKELMAAADTYMVSAVDDFYSDIVRHVEDGRVILQTINDIITTPCQRCRSGLKYDIVLLYDVLVALIPELKFYEVRLALNGKFI